MSSVTYRAAERSDLEGVLAVQREAFFRIAEELHIAPDGMPPLREDLGDLEALFDSRTRFLVAFDDGRIVGTVRFELDRGTVHIGRLAVASTHVRQGVATGLMEAVESVNPDARTFELFTGANAYAPLALYAKLGYRQTRSRRIDSVELVWLEKAGRRP